MKRLGKISFQFFFTFGILFSAEESEVFKNPTVGFEITKPAGWHYLTADENLENIKKLKLNDEELDAAMKKYTTAPLIAMTKFPEPYDDLNPSFKVNIKPLGKLKGKDPKEIIGVMLPQFEKMFKDFRLAQSPKEVEVSGLKSAYMRINYSLEAPNGNTYPTTSELWIVVRGDYFFVLGAGTRQDEKNGSREEIQRIVSSIKIEK